LAGLINKNQFGNNCAKVRAPSMGFFAPLVGNKIFTSCKHAYYVVNEAISYYVNGKTGVFSPQQKASNRRPLLFNIFINDLIEECLQEGIGAKKGNINVSIIAYFDDIILLSTTRAHLERLLKICNKYAYD
jgi:hypothetical protein